MHRSILLRSVRSVACCMCFLSIPATAESVIDSIQFGNTDSEAAHSLKAESSVIIDGALGTSVRQLLPPKTKGWLGGQLTFEMAVDPDKPNYFTAKFWGGDYTGEHSRLALFIDGKQIGQRHLGEVDMLDTMYSHQRYPGRFFYKTVPLPENMTKGKKTVELTIKAQGPIWGYGRTAEQFQKPMTQPSRGIYRVYVHTDLFFAPGSDEIQGDPITEYPAAPTPGPEVFKKTRKRVNDEIAKQLRGGDDLSTEAIQFLAMAYLEPGTPAFGQHEVLEKIVLGIDTHYKKFKSTPEYEPEHEWHGYGPAADAVRMLADKLEPVYDRKIEDTNVTRRIGWAEMFATSRDWHVMRRRSYTNQSMIVDVNIYRCNRAVEVLNPRRAWPESRALRLLHESAGLEPWSGSFGADGRPTWSKGGNYILLTDAGLTKELGYVGHYGEIVLDIVSDMYNSTRPTPDAEGDAKLKEQLVKMGKARAVFRYPMPDDDGHRTMQIETVVGWRDWYYPGGPTYDQMSAPLDAASQTMSPELVGYAQQMLDDNQFFAWQQGRAKGRGWDLLKGLLVSPGNYKAIEAQPEQPHRLPMTEGQPDFVFADPEIGVLALKNGDDILYASLYWRARYAINNLARVHYLTPTMERDATIHIETRFKDSGMVFTMPDQTNEPFSTRHEKFYKAAGMHLAVAGQQQPIARVPSDQKDYKPGKENIFAGKGDFYLMTYGPYLVAMNCADKRSFKFDLPEAFRGSKDLVTGETVNASRLTTKPLQTIVLYRD